MFNSIIVTIGLALGRPFSLSLILLIVTILSENHVEYVSSIKGGFQLSLDGFPYTRHRNRRDTTYWRCVQFKPLGYVFFIRYSNSAS